MSIRYPLSKIHLWSRPNRVNNKQQATNQFTLVTSNAKKRTKNKNMIMMKEKEEVSKASGGLGSI